MKNWVCLLAAVCLLFLWATAAGAAEITVAAASNMNYAVKDIIKEFEEKTGHKVRLSTGSSGNFYSQIANGAPFEVFLSADTDYPKKLEEAGLSEPGTLFVYSIGTLVLWVSKDSPIDVTKGMEAVLHPSVKKIAIANPKLAPYGRAAEAALRHYKFYDQVREKFVLGENVSQTTQFVQTGGADIGFIPLAIALSVKDAGRYWEIPAAAHPAIEQAAVVLKTARTNNNLEAARAFSDFVKGAPGRAVLKRYGYALPELSAQHAAADHDECGKLPSSLAAVVSAMSKAGTKVSALAAKGSMTPLAAGADRFDVALSPADRVQLLNKPSESPEPFAGLVAVSVPRAGLYRISVSTHLWLEVFDGDTRLQRVRLEPRLHCGAVQKSLGYELRPERTYWLQLSGNKSPEVLVMITPE